MNVFASFLCCGFLALAHGATLPGMGEECEPSMGAEASRRFAYELYSKAAQLGEPDDNIFLAPTTVASAVSMLIAGAGGRTKEQIWSGLMFGKSSEGYTDDDLPCLLRIYSNELVAARLAESKVDNELKSFENPLALRTASRLFGDSNYMFSDDFIAKTASYGAELEKISFSEDPDAARERINGWVERVTEEKIKDLFSRDDITFETKLAIASAIYFKGAWKTPFEPDSTVLDDFRVSSTKTVQAFFMTNNARYKSYYSEDLQAELLELPYKEDAYGRYDVSMIIVLPTERSIQNLEQRLTEENLSPAMTQLFDSFPSYTYVRVPKFKMELEYKLQPILESMGMKDMFVGGVANFTAMKHAENTDGRPLYVNSAVHKTFVEVDEVGTVAAGATGIGLVPLSLPPTINCNRPFLTIIYEKKSESVLFIGKVSEPML